MMAQQIPRYVKCITTSGNSGKGAALKKSTDALAKESSYVLCIDADNSIACSYDALFNYPDYDIVIGSKWHKQSKLYGYSIIRRFYSFCYYRLIGLLFKIPIRDTQTGLKLYKTSVFKDIASRVKTNGFCFDLEALVLAMKSDKNGIYNIGTGKSYSLNEVISILNRKLNKSIRPKYVENPLKNYVEHTLADTTKAKKELNFESKYTLEEGIDNLLK